MNHRAASLDGWHQPIGQEHVAGDPLEPLEALEVRLRAGADEAADREAVGLKGANQGLADEAGATRDEDALHRRKIPRRCYHLFLSSSSDRRYHRSMWRTTRVLGCALALLAAGAASAAQPDLSGVDEAVKSVVSAGDLPGAVVLVGQGERVLYRKDR